MSGRKQRNRWSIILAIVFTATGMLGETVADSVKTAVVILSSNDEAYTRPVATFTDELRMPVEIFNLHGEIANYKEQMRKILSRNPILIFALGAKAAYIAKLETLKQGRQDVPVVFAMVLNWERYELLRGSNNVAGIAIDIEPGTQFANLAMFAPEVKKIGVIYSEKHSAGIITKARRAARMLRYELIARPITRQKDFRRAFEEISDNIQVYWILADPVVFSTNNMSWLKKRCLRHHIITIGQSENVVKLGMLLGINTDPGNIGIQAASMARNIVLHNQSPKTIGVMPPLGTSLVLNIKTANKLGLKIDQLAMGMTNKIVE